MNRPSGGARPRALACRITTSDIDAMFAAYDSGMCDTTTANCLSQCLARQLQRSQPVRLHRHSETCASFHIDHHRLAVPPDLLAWLNAVETGAPAAPVDFTLDIPAELSPTPEPPRHPLALPLSLLP